MSDHDVCECGDSRASHVFGRGACGVCRWATRYWEPCRRFRLMRAAEIVAGETGGER
jgi:hypothetical protein